MKEMYIFFEPTVFDDNNDDFALSVLSRKDDVGSNGMAKLRSEELGKTINGSVIYKFGFQQS